MDVQEVEVVQQVQEVGVVELNDEARGPHEEESCEDHSLHDVQVDALQ